MKRQRKQLHVQQNCFADTVEEKKELLTGQVVQNTGNKES